MMLSRTKYVILVVLILVFAGCGKIIYEQEATVSVEPKVYLSVSVHAAHPKSGLRSSINKDDALDDHVHSLAMLIFNSGDAGDRVGLVKLNNNIGSGEAAHVFTVELTADKKYDFYFVANMPDMEVDLAGITSRSEMDNYLNNTSRKLNVNLYRGAASAEGFPMARIYRNQKVEAGGTVYQPSPFKPKQYISEYERVVVNVAGEGTVEREYVELIRVVAKLEVNLAGSNLGVKNIYFRNANQNFCLVNTDNPTYSNNDGGDILLNEVVSEQRYIYYMPETFTDINWSSTGNNSPINYFTIETTSGTKYDIPIITYDEDGGGIQNNYLKKAMGQESGFNPNYNIYRNRNYVYTVNNLQKIEIIYEIDPWEKVNKFLYMGYGYYVEVDEDGNVTVINTVNACPPHTVRLVAVGGASFTNPAGTEIVFDDSDPGVSSPTYTLTNIPPSGEFLEVYYNEEEGNTEAVYTFSK